MLGGFFLIIKVMKIEILTPSKENMIIPKGSSFLVSGELELDNETNLLFKCELFDENNRIIRLVSSNVFGNTNIDTQRNDLTLYPKGIDDDLKELKKFGFCELIKDGSFNKASNKCYFDDKKFRCLIYSCSNAIFNDGINLVDDNGNEFKELEKGKYKIVVSIIKNEIVLCSNYRFIEIGSYNDTLICRVNPIEHKLNMFKWAKENNYAAWIDDLPGYLSPYHNNEWYYHMGLLPLYRANDICLYREGKVHMFIYQTADNSTSYESEYGYLQSIGVIDNKDRFISYAYDIGETKIGNRSAQIIELNEDIHLYRIDKVKDSATENVYDMDETNTIDSLFENYEFVSGDKIAISGVVKPYQLDINDFILRKDNTYEIKNKPNKLIYEFICDDRVKRYEKELNMLRYKSKELERSVFEFYNIFKLDESFKNKTWNLSIKLYDLKNINTKTINNIEIEVK